MVGIMVYGIIIFWFHFKIFDKSFFIFLFFLQYFIILYKQTSKIMNHLTFGFIRLNSDWLYRTDITITRTDVIVHVLARNCGIMSKMLSIIKALLSGPEWLSLWCSKIYVYTEKDHSANVSTLKIKMENSRNRCCVNILGFRTCFHYKENQKWPWKNPHCTNNIKNCIMILIGAIFLVEKLLTK